jgi:hypothetical protein
MIPLLVRGAKSWRRVVVAVKFGGEFDTAQFFAKWMVVGDFFCGDVGGMWAWVAESAAAAADGAGAA